MSKELIQHFSQLVTEHKAQLLHKVIQDRTKYITVVLEDIFQSHNASAVLRTCDCFGIQDVHIIENRNEYRLNPDIALGAAQWLNLHKYNEQENNTVSAIRSLKKQGYRIIATTPHTDDVELEQLDLSKGKIALLFGSEQPGLTQTALDEADEFMKIPMQGFTESFNISVSAAIILHHLSYQMRQSNIAWQLTEDEKDTQLLNWYRQSIRLSEQVEKEFLKQQK